MEHGIRIRTVILLWILLSGVSGMYAQSCLPEGITFTTQAQIDSFPILYPNCTDIEGFVQVIGDNITNLDSLIGVTSIGDLGLWIIECTSLGSLSGLDNLRTIGLNLVIKDNDALTDLSGLNNIMHIGQNMTISDNDGISNLSGLDSLSHVEYILKISNNDNLIDLTGIENIDTIGYLRIRDNMSLMNLTGLEIQSSALVGLNIINNNSLSSLVNLESINLVEEYCNIIGNNSLTDLNGLNNINSMGSLAINENISLVNLYGLESLSYVTDYLTIGYNDVLTTLSGLDSLSVIGGSLSIGSNDSLYSIEHLSGLTTVGGYQLSIIENSKLSSLTGIDNIDASTVTNLYIYQNPLLSTCEVQSICEYLTSPNGIVDIYDNATGCNSQEEVEEACEWIGIIESSTKQQLSTYPNPFTTSTTIEYELTEPSHIQLTIYNAIGEQVYKTEDRMMPVGKHSFVWTADRLPEGMYYAVIRSEEGVSVVKMIKQ